MISSRACRFAVVLAFSSLLLPGQTVNPPSDASANRPLTPASDNSAADQAWTAFTNLQKSAATPAAAGQGVSASAQVQAQKTAQAQSARQVAAAAKDFYTRFPSHAEAAKARKQEALSALAGITDDDLSYETTALKTAGDFRVNKANPIADRFDVAHAVERHTVGRKLGGKSWLSAPFESEAMADRLSGEFGHFPGVYANYLHVAEHTTCDHSRDVARRILQMPAPAYVKAGAQRALDRALLMQKPLDFQLTTVDGAPTRLSILAGSGTGQRTVVVFWEGSRTPAGPPGLHPYAKSNPANTRWVYVSLGGWTKPVATTPSAPGKGNANGLGNGNSPSATLTVRTSTAPPGTYCVDHLGWKSPLVAQLKISQLPFVCVLDDKKNLNAFGRVDEIPALLAGINRLVEP